MKKKSFLKFVLWFTLLSTLGVGGGIFFLLYAVVPIEEWYVTRGWSQFKVDGVMKYYVYGWVIFGFAVSFVYYYLLVKKERWKSSAILCLASVVLCVFALNYFLNTNSSLVQASQGELEVGNRFTFGPYPEAADLEKLKSQGYDGVIALLSDKLPIEKPLIDKLQADGEAIGIEIISMPMLPWVGDNAATLKKIQELVEKDDKRYYIHCYLGRHRVDVVKQLVSKYNGEEIELLVLQATSLERGHLYYDSANEVLFGPYPTEEEWFTRIKRGEVQEIISLLRPDSAVKYTAQEKAIANELNIEFTQIPIEKEYTLADLQKIVDVIKAKETKVFVHKFSMDSTMNELLTLHLYGKTIYPLTEVEEIEKNALTVSAKYIVGPSLSEEQKVRFKALGIEEFVLISNNSPTELYKQLNRYISADTLVYFETNLSAANRVHEMLKHLYKGYDKYKKVRDYIYGDKNVVMFGRNLALGTIIEKDDEIERYIIKNGIHKVFYIHYPTVDGTVDAETLKEKYEKFGVKFEIVIYDQTFEERIVQKINAEQNNIFIMTTDNLLPEINLVIDKY